MAQPIIASAAHAEARELLLAYEESRNCQHRCYNNAHAEHCAERIDGIVYLRLENHERYGHHRRTPQAFGASSAQVKGQKAYARRGIDDRRRRDELHAEKEYKQRENRDVGTEPDYVFLFYFHFKTPH